jgi:hypothetical protein
MANWQQGREARNARIEAGAKLASGKIVEARDATRLLEAVVQPRDRVCLEGDNQNARLQAVRNGNAMAVRAHDVATGPAHGHTAADMPQRTVMNSCRRMVAPSAFLGQCLNGSIKPSRNGNWRKLVPKTDWPPRSKMGRSRQIDSGCADFQSGAISSHFKGPSAGLKCARSRPPNQLSGLDLTALESGHLSFLGRFRHAVIVPRS